LGILDITNISERVGCEDLYKRVMEINPKVHAFGHIHSSYGMKEMDGMTFINASNLGEDYLYQNDPITLDFEFDV
jgi:Icc-related predicted phosphoesterase